jgi:hypothetical protein
MQPHFLMFQLSTRLGRADVDFLVEQRTELDDNADVNVSDDPLGQLANEHVKTVYCWHQIAFGCLIEAVESEGTCYCD